MISGRCCRAVRAALFAAVCVLLAATGHLLMSGRPVPWWALAGAFAATAAGSWALAAGERGRRAVTVASLTAQALLHGGFTLAQPAAASGAGAHAHGAGHAMAAMGPMVSGPSAPGCCSAGMLAAHLLAAVLCALWLACAERGLFQALRALAGWLRAPLRALFGPAALLPRLPGGPVRRGRRSRAPRRLLLVHSLASRGPPQGTAVV
ncbi:hypothetical protein AB0940_22035 [Streptomyces sp. NPDC006656]|uniref:hypothetical protein n=1 Tax=Streptomyces sp. NPDC006656 TaxID=3156899 RepID=UPI003455DC60